jgi:hypothetical protein
VAAHEAPEKRPKAATCQQSFVKLSLMACPSGCQNPPAKIAARGSITKARGCWGDRAAFSEFSSILREPQCKQGFTMYKINEGSRLWA